MELVIPEKWNEWTQTEFLGEGSYGEVYKAENAAGDVCAIKVIEIPKSKEEADSIRREYGDEETVKSFYTNLVEDYEKEIQLLDSLKDEPNIVRIYDYYKEPNGVGWKLYIRMEYLQGFNEYCDLNDIDEDRAIRFALDICNALIQCEKLGIVHRDLKPDNILVDPDGTLKLCDFGLARTLDASKGSYSIKGTFSYMAPEIYLGRKYGNQVDIYSLGIILYRLLNKGREPFVPVDKKLIYYKDKETALTRRMDGEKFPDPVEATPGMAAIIQKACAYNTDDRYKSAVDMKADLLKLQKGSFRKRLLTYTQKRRLLISVIAAVIVIMCAAVYIHTQILTGAHASLSSDGVLTVYGDDPVTEKTVAKYREGATKLVIKDGVTEIGEGCFDSFENLNDVEIAGSVTKIGAGAFSGCTALTSVDLSGSNIKEIEGGAFQSCSALQTVSLPDGITAVNASLFDGCENLQEIDFGNSAVTMIDENAFSYCTALSSVDIPDSVETIGISAFEDCTSLSSVQLGSKTETLEDTAFCGCGSLESISGVEHVRSFGGDVFTNTAWEKKSADSEGFLILNGELLRYIGEDSELVIPENVKTIGNSAFSDADTVRKVTIGKNVTAIEDLAFAYSMISQIDFESPENIKEIGEDAFSETPWLQSQLMDSSEIKIGNNTIKSGE